MTDIAIKVENISKKYQIGENKTYPTLRDKLMELPNRLFKGPKKTKEFWALKDVSFEVKKGEVVGIIGRNGAGKSTMLKILARITEPTSGKVTMYGRVASMLEVGTGFNPELTGRENIYLNGAIIGMTKREITQKFDEIVAFSGVEKFLDTPVKHYSSGMYVRLAFAVAAHLDADILLVDEVLAVGDAEFQKKCLGKMDDLAKSGRTVILVSHNIGSLKKICTKGIIFDQGVNISDLLEIKQAIQKYIKNGENIDGKLPKNITYNDEIIFDNFQLQGQNLIYRPSFTDLEKFEFSIRCRCLDETQNQDLVLSISIVNNVTGETVIYGHNHLYGVIMQTNKVGKISILFEGFQLQPGEYSVYLESWLDGQYVIQQTLFGIFLIKSSTIGSKSEVFNSFPSQLLMPMKWSYSK
ncbi:hypothetical protein DCC61_02260 [Candidatus Microgenomates bacterium]|nr:MAG: hypothetical protein DCC61_02260 [Candidatus Microgenomates bacterium]